MKRAAAAALVLALPYAAAAQESAAFLTLGSGARPAAMSGAYVAIGDDSSAAAWNPAGHAGARTREVQLTHRESLLMTRHEILGVTVPAARGVFGVSASYLSHGALPGRDAAGAPTGRYNASDLSAGLTYAAKLPGWAGLSLGTGAKYINSAIAEGSAQGYAFDFGARYERPFREGAGTPMAGLAVRNIGPGLRYLDERTPLPLVLSAGVGYRLASGLLLDVDYSRRPRALIRDEIAAGAELALVPAFLVRGGFGSLAARTDGGGMASFARGFTVGFGIKFSAWTLDYSIVPMGELGNAQTFSVAARF